MDTRSDEITTPIELDALAADSQRFRACVETELMRRQLDGALLSVWREVADRWGPKAAPALGVLRSLVCEAWRSAFPATVEVELTNTHQVSTATGARTFSPAYICQVMVWGDVWRLGWASTPYRERGDALLAALASAPGVKA